jgi:hypothetical protein
MIKTGKFNPLGEEIIQIEESDINFWDKNWDDLELGQKADFCSFIKAPFLGKQNEKSVKQRYVYYQAKNTMEY